MPSFRTNAGTDGRFSGFPQQVSPLRASQEKRWPRPTGEQLTSGNSDALGDPDYRDPHRFDFVLVVVVEQVRPILDGGGTALAESDMAVAVRWLHRVAAVLAHPALELPVLIL